MNYANARQHQQRLDSDAQAARRFDAVLRKLIEQPRLGLVQRAPKLRQGVRR